jgi:hypothetical protein
MAIIPTAIACKQKIQNIALIESLSFLSFPFLKKPLCPPGSAARASLRQAVPPPLLVSE